MNPTTVSADSRVEAIKLLEYLQCGHVFESGHHLDTSDQHSNQTHFFTLGSVAEESVMPDSDESVRENMH